MFFRKQCWHLVSEWTLGLMNALKYQWYKSILLSQAVLKRIWCTIKKCARGTGAKNEEIYGIVPHQKFLISCYNTFKTKTLTCGSQMGHMWVTSGLFCRSVGQTGQQVWPTFNPDVYVCIHPSSHIFHLSVLHIPNSIPKYPLHQYIQLRRFNYTYVAKCVNLYLISTIHSVHRNSNFTMVPSSLQ